MPFFSERQRMKNILEQEAAGKVLWSSVVPAPARQKIENLILPLEKMANEGRSSFSHSSVFSIARTLLMQDRGLTTLRGIGNPKDDFKFYLQKCDNGEFPDVLESLCVALEHADGQFRSVTLSELFTRNVNKILESYRISYSLEQGEVVPFVSRELHESVVVPALNLLANKKWLKAEKPYLEAIKEISNDKPGNAITDATTALQEGMRIAGCKGDNFADLMKSAKSGIFKGFDATYLDGIEKLIKWTSAARSNRGDSHKTVEVDNDDAWFVVHVVGVLLLRLSKMK